VSGPAAELNAFRDRARGLDAQGQPSELRFSSILPTPKRLLTGGRWLDTASGKRALADWQRAEDKQERMQVLSRHPGLFLLCRDGELKERDGEGWHTWRLLNWGTKWDASDVRARRKNGRLVYDFLTAWSPPLPFVSACARRQRGLVFELTYQESGCCFAGFVRFARGRLVHETESEDVDECAELLEQAGLEQAAALWDEDTLSFPENRPR
jgi:hypothetical protein